MHSQIIKHTTSNEKDGRVKSVQRKRARAHTASDFPKIIIDF